MTVLIIISSVGLAMYDILSTVAVPTDPIILAEGTQKGVSINPSHPSHRHPLDPNEFMDTFLRSAPETRYQDNPLEG